MADPEVQVDSGPRFVLDTSAIMALLNGEPEAPAVLALLDDATNVDASIELPFLALMEVEYLLLRRYPPGETQSYLAAMRNWPVSIVESFEQWRSEAARVKAQGNISVVDAWVAALGLLHGAQVIHKDPQFEGVLGLRTLDIRR